MAQQKKGTIYDTPWAVFLKDVAQQARLIGLGALSKVQSEGGKLLETLIEEGQAVDARMAKAASETRAAPGSAGGTRHSALVAKLKAAVASDNMEEIFEARVMRALEQLQIPTQADLQSLHAQLDALHQQIAALQKPPAQT